MTKKVAKRVTATFLSGDGKELPDVVSADWLLIKPVDAIDVIKVGNRDHTQSNSALAFASDAYRFGKYAGPGTDWVEGVHVYTSVGDNVYVEDGATVKVNGVWYSANYRKPNGHASITLGRVLDPVDHTTEIIARMQARGADLNKQADAAEREQKRARWDMQRMKKHEWGDFYGYAFQIWIAHERKLGQAFYDLVNETDDKKAIEMRNLAIDGKIAYNEHVRPVVKAARTAQTSIKTDQPDFEESDGDEPKEEPKPVEAIVMSYVRGSTLTNLKVDLLKVSPLAGLQLWIKVRNNGVRTLNWWRNWDPSDLVQLNELRGFANDPELAIGFPENYLPAEYRNAL